MATQKSRGFTLVELIVVLAMLAVLIVGLTFIFNPFKQINKTYDAQRVEDLNAIAQSLDSYYNDHSFYPQSVPFGQKWGDVNSIYMQKVPEDPQQLANEGYCYFSDPTSSAPQWNVLFAKLTSSQNSPQCHLSSNCLPKGYTNDWACKASGNVDCNVLSGSTLPCVTPPPANQPTPTPYGGYALDDTKLFQTYAEFFFNPPSFLSTWYDVDVSLSPNFPNNSSQTYTYFAPSYAPEFMGNYSLFTRDWLVHTTKFAALQSLPNLVWSGYQCGKTIYWKVYDFPGHTQSTQTFSNTVDCSTKVGAFSATGPAPLNWYIYYPYINGYTDAVSPGEPYNVTMDANGDGKINWQDYVILDMSTQMRAGGWEPPE